MIRPDIYIEDTRLGSLGWLRETVRFPTPKSQSNTIVVPGRNSPIRYTQALGRTAYQPRTFEIVLSMLGSRKSFDGMAAELANRYAGKLCQVRTSEEPDLYCLGTLEMEPAYDPIIRKGQVTISCEDGDSYRYHMEETAVQVTGGGKIALENDFMPVIPVVTATAETSLSWKVGTDTFRKSVSSGTWTFPELELSYGKNEIMITTEGTVTFRYREGRL